MNLRKRLIQLFFCLAVQATAHAGSTLTISLINQSNYELVFDEALVEFPGNTLTIDKKTLPPGETATIIGTTTPAFDLSGVLYFNDGAVFWIVTYRQFNASQPVFAMHATKVLSSISARTRNPEIGSRLLSCTAASVVLKDKFPF